MTVFGVLTGALAEGKNKKERNNSQVSLIQATCSYRKESITVVFIKGTMLPPCGDEHRGLHSSFSRLDEHPHFRRLNA